MEMILHGALFVLVPRNEQMNAAKKEALFCRFHSVPLKLTAANQLGSSRVKSLQRSSHCIEQPSSQPLIIYGNLKLEN